MELKQKMLVAVAVIVFIVLSQWVIFGIDREAWFDVSFSLQTVHAIDERGLGSIDFTQYDVHPIIYYYMLAGWQKLNPGWMTEYHWAEELSVLCSAGFILIAAITLVVLFGEIGGYAVILLAACTTYLHYGTEPRMYALLLLLSAVMLYAVAVKRMDGRWAVIAGIAALLLPLTHYLAFMAVPFYAGMHVVLAMRRKEKAFDRRIWIFLGLALVGLLLALHFALPQRARSTGTWFEPPTVDEWPSALMYAMFMVDLYTPTGVMAFVYMLVYMAFGLLLIGLMWLGFRSLKKEMDEQALMMFLMGCTALFPLAGLVSAPLFGLTSFGQGFAHLYHHRFFLLLTWMFTALVFMLLFRWAMAKRSVFRYTSVLVVLIVLAGSIYVYDTKITHHELSNIEKAMPCPKGNESQVQIAHESAFSSLPFDVYARQEGCNWREFISTNMTKGMQNAGGFDAVAQVDIYNNLTLPLKGDYFYVYAAGTLPIDGVPSVVHKEDGVELWFIKRGNVTHDYVNWTFLHHYDNASDVQYTVVEWVPK